MSESDYPPEIVRRNGEIAITPEYLCSISARPADSPTKETDLETFFQMSGRFKNVMDLIKHNLAEVEVYKVGEINIPVYIVGRSPEGNWLRLSTHLIQTWQAAETTFAVRRLVATFASGLPRPQTPTI